ncbi:hypothetical protein E4U52_000301 [Claviceps spartinae]|nr:hypothetical protein E4U52_000301 [Claviceps spartinae]
MDINPEIEMPDPSELFSFTSGRFVENEEHELAQRYREFDFNELARRAARAVQADRCLSIEKFPDGLYNKVLAKIPNLNFPRPHLTIASEVATMKFAREVLCTDVPKVYDWSSMAHETAVGAEFILMEKVNGVELQQVWPRMEVEDRRELVKSVTAYQKSWASVTFDKYGSLYVAEDFKGENISFLVYTNEIEKGQKVEDSRFVIGPSTSRDMFEYGRGVVEFDRGPWSSLEFPMGRSRDVPEKSWDVPLQVPGDSHCKVPGLSL